MAGMKEVSGNKTGENLASIVMEIIKDWEIQSQLGYFMMDNASDNDVMMRHVTLGMFTASFTAFANNLGEISVKASAFDTTQSFTDYAVPAISSTSLRNPSYL